MAAAVNISAACEKNIMRCLITLFLANDKRQDQTVSYGFIAARALMTRALVINFFDIL